MKCIHDDEEDFSCIECSLFEVCWEPIIGEVNKILAEIEGLQALQSWSYILDIDTDYFYRLYYSTRRTVLSPSELLRLKRGRDWHPLTLKHVRFLLPAWKQWVCHYPVNDFHSSGFSWFCPTEQALYVRTSPLQSR